jgi:hypothetical protein
MEENHWTSLTLYQRLHTTTHDTSVCKPHLHCQWIICSWDALEIRSKQKRYKILISKGVFLLTINQQNLKNQELFLDFAVKNKKRPFSQQA